MKLPAWILEKWTEAASPPPPWKRGLDLCHMVPVCHPSSSAVGRQPWEVSGTTRVAIGDYHTSQRPGCFPSNGAVPVTPALGRHTWTRCANGSSLPTENTLRGFSPRFSSSLPNLQKPGVGGSTQTRWQSDVPGLQIPEVSQGERG